MEFALLAAIPKISRATPPARAAQQRLEHPHSQWEAEIPGLCGVQMLANTDWAVAKLRGADG